MTTIRDYPLAIVLDGSELFAAFQNGRQVAVSLSALNKVGAGQPGLSAYQIWRLAGNTGSEADFLASLVGPAGTPLNLVDELGEDSTKAIAQHVVTDALGTKADQTSLSLTRGALAQTQAEIAYLAPRQPRAAYDDLAELAREAVAICNYAGWDDDLDFTNVVSMPRFRPLGGDPSTNWGLVDNNAVRPVYWMMTMLLRALAAKTRFDPLDRPNQRRIELQVAYLTSTAVVSGQQVGYSDADFAGNGIAAGLVHASDDASWMSMSLAEFHRQTGDPVWLHRAETNLIAALAFFQDPNTAPLDCGNGVLCSQYGTEYATIDGDANGQGRATLMECGLIDTALYIWSQTKTPGFLAYAQHMATVWRVYHKNTTTALGAYHMDLQIDPTGHYDGTAYLKPLDFDPVNSPAKAIPVRGSSLFSICGLMSAGVINAKLYRYTGDAQWLTEALSINSAIRDHFVQPDGTILNDRDPWIDGYFFPDYVTWVLGDGSNPGLPGIDADGAVAAAIITTARWIMTNGRRPGGLSGDWGVPRASQTGSTTNGFTTWDAQGAFGGPGAQAVADQQMTTCNTAMVVIAGAMLSRIGAAPPMASPSATSLSVKQAAARLGYRATIEDAFTLLRSADPYAPAVDQWDASAPIAANDAAYQVIVGTNGVGAEGAATIFALAATL